MKEKIEKLMREDYLKRKELNLHNKTGIIKLKCPNCNEKITSNYFRENGGIIGLVDCNNCKILLIVKI